MTRPGDQIRNSNERAWTLAGLTIYNATRWDQLYKNQSNLRCSLRVKYEEFRILWGRQELNRYKSRYANLGGDSSTACSYCHDEIETELHLYVECEISREFWLTARKWYSWNIGVSPPIVLSGPLLFGLEKEQPQDLFIDQSDTAFLKTERKELRLKYNKNKILRYKTEEAKAVAWLSAQMGWTGTDFNWPRKS